MGWFSALSVLAGALCGLAAFEALAAIGGAAVVGIHGSTNFATWGATTFRIVTVAVICVAMALGFLFGGYIGGRMSRRRGATHGLLAGVLGVILALAAGVTVWATGAEHGLVVAARHLNVVATSQAWRNYGLLAAVVAIGTMVIFGLIGGASGERWHAKLMARAVDPTFGPEARRREAARKAAIDAETARIAAAQDAGRQAALRREAAAYSANDGAGDETRPLRRPAAAETDREDEAAPVEGRPRERGTEAVPTSGIAAVSPGRTRNATLAAERGTDESDGNGTGESHGWSPRHLLHH
ncbi:MAG: TIGR04086 family membrane protein [Acidimicrobiales bacterium]